MTFEEYLVKKRINKTAFEAEDTVRYRSWESMYAQMHPNSFYMAVKMVINDVRLRYHLKEEDVPKPAPAIVPPKPAVRRAAATQTPPAPQPETPVSSDSSEVPANKPAAFKPRPVVKRPASLHKSTEEKAEAEKPVAEGQTAAIPAEEAEKPAAKPRPVIKRPVIPKPAIASDTDQETTGTPQAPEGATGSADKPARPRPVMKRPAALQKPTGNTDADASAPVAPLAEQPAADQVPGASKPARPRPVIKRPAALTKPAGEQDPTQKSGEETAKAEELHAAPKSPRPRPVIKKPSPPVTTEPAASTGESDKQEPPVQENKPKPPRPRPIIKKPSNPDESGGATGL